MPFIVAAEQIAPGHFKMLPECLIMEQEFAFIVYRSCEGTTGQVPCTQAAWRIQVVTKLSCLRAP